MSENLRAERNRQKLPKSISLLLLGSLLLSAPSRISASSVSPIKPYDPPSGYTETDSSGRSTSELKSGTDKLAYALALASRPENLPSYDPFWYDSLMLDGLISPAEKEALFSTYYRPSPDVFTGTATRYGPLSSMLADIPFYGQVIREQMQRGYVLAASGSYGYHHELKDALPQWAPGSVYGKKTDVDDILLDDQNSPVYIYLAERQLDGPYNQPAAVTYDELNKKQQLIYDMSSDGKWSKRFVPVGTHRQMGPDKSLRSGTFVSTVAGISPNDIGRRFLLFSNDESGRMEFYGVVLVIECIQRADWTGLGSVSSSFLGNNPMLLRSQKNPDTGKKERWAFDFPDELYRAMGGNGGPVYGVTAIDADFLEYLMKQPKRYREYWSMY